MIFVQIIVTFAVLLLHICLPTSPRAELTTGDTAYISDYLIINLRDNIEKPYEVVGVVNSNDPVTILDNEGNYYRVQTQDDTIGWISKQYVKAEFPKTIIINRLEEQLKKLREQLSTTATGDPDTIEPEELKQLQEELEASRHRTEQLQKELQELKNTHMSGTDKVSDTGAMDSQLDTLRDKLRQSQERYQLLAEDHVKRGEKIAELQNSLARQSDKSKYFWFGAGAVVFFIGLIAGRSGSKKRSKFTY